MKQDVIDRHRGRWVVVSKDDEDVLVDAGSLAELASKAIAMSVTEGTMQRIPAADEPLFIGAA